MSRVFKGPSYRNGANEYRNAPDKLLMNGPDSPLDWEDFSGLEPPNTQPMVGHRPASRANRKSRAISGPSYSSAKDLEYKGT